MVDVMGFEGAQDRAPPGPAVRHSGMLHTGLPVPGSFNFADLWESVWPRVADRTALVCAYERRTYAQLAGNVNRLARHLQASGVGVGDHVAICMPNRVEWVEAMLAAFTLRAVPVNMNHRYTTAELGPLLFADGADTIVFDSVAEPELAPIASALPHSRRLRVGDPPEKGAISATAYDEALRPHSPEPLETSGRRGGDHYVMYTGGTTGRPKGVVWRQEDAFFACLGGGDPMRLSGPVTYPTDILDRIVESFSFLPVAPMMHAAAQWTTLSWLFAGGKTTLMPGTLDPEAVWQAVEDEGVNALTVIGNAVGRPLLAAWEANPGRWDASTILSISNGGAPMSASLKRDFARAFPGRVITDGFGSSESGVQGAQRIDAGNANGEPGLARFTPGPGTQVFDDNLRPVRPGSGRIGRVANTGRLPLGYLGDPAKTKATFLTVDAQRYCFTGDLAKVHDDGTIELLGRGSQCINTGGEKVFPEEVEGVLLDHPAVADVLVVGVVDERWGKVVTAVVEPSSPASPPTLSELRAHARGRLAGYKLPKHLVLVDRAQRSPAGKADYRWAQEAANRAVGVNRTGSDW